MRHLPRIVAYLEPQTALEAGAPAADAETARESAILLLGLPWELLHDGDDFLFQARSRRVSAGACRIRACST